MDKFSLNYLADGMYDNAKDQIVLHAVCNLVSEPYVPVLRGITPNAISERACNLLSRLGVVKNPTGDIGTCSALVRSLMNISLDKGLFSKDELQGEVCKLMETTYAGEYIRTLPPF